MDNWQLVIDEFEKRVVALVVNADRDLAVRVAATWSYEHRRFVEVESFDGEVYVFDADGQLVGPRPEGA